MIENNIFSSKKQLIYYWFNYLVYQYTQIY